LKEKNRINFSLTVNYFKEEYGGGRMKSCKKFLIILAVSTVLLALFNVPKVGKAQTILQTPFQMPCNAFQVQPYFYTGSVISNGSIEYLSLPSNSLPMGILYDNNTNVVWVALNWNRSIAKINVTTKECELYQLPVAVTVPYLQIVTLSGKRIILNAIEDARVREAFPDTNYGNDSYLSVLRFDVSERSFLKFDISNMSEDISSATLNLYVKEFGNTVNRTYEVNKVIEDWSESSITWNNQPNIAKEFQVNVSAPTSIGWFSIDVTPIVNNALELNETTVSFRIKDSDETGCPCTYTYFCSKEDLSVYKGPKPWTLTITPDGNIWFSINAYMFNPKPEPERKPYLGKLDIVNNIIYIYYVPVEGNDVKFDGSYIWLLGSDGLAKIDYASETVLEYYRLESTMCMALDSNYIWISKWTSDGIVYRFNTITRTFDLNLTGFDMPLGLFVDNEYVYVAENSRKKGSMGTIAKINKATLIITRLNTAPITDAGPYNVLKDSYGYLWFTDHSHHVGIVGGLYYNAPAYCYFMTEVPGNSIWFSAVGSAYIGIKAIGTLGKTDINRDGRVDMDDIGLVCMQFGKRVPPAPVDCDINNDGKIDMDDIGFVCKNFGKVL
jgi:streptogramin lyase